MPIIFYRDIEEDMGFMHNSEMNFPGSISVMPDRPPEPLYMLNTKRNIFSGRKSRPPGPKRTWK